MWPPPSSSLGGLVTTEALVSPLFGGDAGWRGPANGGWGAATPASRRLLGLRDSTLGCNGLDLFEPLRLKLPDFNNVMAEISCYPVQILLNTECSLSFSVCRRGTTHSLVYSAARPKQHRLLGHNTLQ